ncbi:hypothetical protein KKC94_00025 [Patescibacteria group bacterium]|nr:hypothetical protein [Patescibacteria group bacterium]
MKNKRPKLITAVCIFMALGALFAIPSVFSDIAKSIGIWYPPFLMISSIVGIIVTVGLWQMKKWSVILYVSMFGVSQIMMLSTGIWNAFALILPGIFIAVIASQYKLMD